MALQSWYLIKMEDVCDAALRQARFLLADAVLPPPVQNWSRAWAHILAEALVCGRTSKLADVHTMTAFFDIHDMCTGVLNAATAS